MHETQNSSDTRFGGHSCLAAPNTPHTRPLVTAGDKPGSRHFLAVVVAAAAYGVWLWVGGGGGSQASGDGRLFRNFGFRRALDSDWHSDMNLGTTATRRRCPRPVTIRRLRRRRGQCGEGRSQPEKCPVPLRLIPGPAQM